MDSPPRKVYEIGDYLWDHNFILATIELEGNSITIVVYIMNYCPTLV